MDPSPSRGDFYRWIETCKRLVSVRSTHHIVILARSRWRVLFCETSDVDLRKCPVSAEISAALLVRADGRTLLVRKRGTTAFMQPGGKIDSGETAQQALVRELNEELGISVDIGSLTPLGRFSAPAANEAGVTVDAALFMVQCDQDVRPAAEIEEAVWIESETRPDFPIASLTGDHVLPLHNQLRGNPFTVRTNFAG